MAVNEIVMYVVAAGLGMTALGMWAVWAQLTNVRRTVQSASAFGKDWHKEIARRVDILNQDLATALARLPRSRARKPKAPKDGAA